jgi:DNA-binding PadR family transcriptional regulator
MGNIYRFIEPVLLLMLKEKGHSYGYDLSESLREYALTDTPIDRPALYRTLRTLEANGYVTSEWETENAGPARRVYALTHKGVGHLAEWAQLLDRLGEAMKTYSKRALALVPPQSRAKAAAN